MESSYIRYRAREILAGKWKIAILVTLVAWLLGGMVSQLGTFEIDIDQETMAKLPAIVQQVLKRLLPAFGLLGLVNMIIGGVVKLGYCSFLLKLRDGNKAEFSDLFSQFHRFGDGFCLELLTDLLVFLWGLLLVIPGIVAALSYAMAPFIMAEDPNMTATQAMRESKELMRGHKMDLFCLQLSFIGWGLLNILTLGIGSLWLNPYVNAAYTAFYHEISDRPGTAFVEGEVVR